jgi:hypothetical protein
MARLPELGGDQGVWGEVLNDFLGQSHTPAGTLKDSVIGTAQLQASSVTTAKLSNPGTANNVAVLDGSAKLPEGQLPDRLSDAALMTKFGQSTSTTAAVVASTAGAFVLPDAEVISLTLGASVSLAMPTYVAGKGLLLYIHQDTIGTRTITWPANVAWPNESGSPVLNMNPSTTNTIAFVCPPAGTQWQGYIVT